MTISRQVFTFPRFVLATALAVALVLLMGLGQATPASAADAAVGINGFAFTPGSLTVAVGTRVVWTNMQANVPHTVTSDTPGVFDSGNLTTGQTFAFTFNTAGSFAYHCNVHPNMHGTIVVQAAGGAAAATTAPAVATTAPATTGAAAATVARPAATGTGGGVTAATLPPAPTPTRPAAATATRPAATTVPVSMPRAGGGGLATSYVGGDDGASRGLWFGIMGIFAVIAAGGLYALRLRRR